MTMPYPGLRPFDEDDKPLFFGREAQVSGLLHQLEDHRLVAVVGSSGSGKSSLVRAGLLPALREGFLFGTTNWLTMVVKPGARPYDNLARAVVKGCGSGDAESADGNGNDAGARVDRVLATLKRTDDGLLAVLRQCRVPPGTNVLVVVDQFEELFAFRRSSGSLDTVASRDDAAAFVSLLLRSSRAGAGLRVVLTMRSDFIGDCEAFLGLPEVVSRSQFLVPRLDREQMAEAIAGPGTVANHGFRPHTFEHGLVNRIINDAGDRPDQLPLMQHSLMRTWKIAARRPVPENTVRCLTHEDYADSGGIENALSLHADAAWDEIKSDPGKARIARQLFLLLSETAPDGQITRRRPRVAEVQTATGATVAALQEVVHAFQTDDRNFLLPSLDRDLTPDDRLDVSHEALLRRWHLFKDVWLNQERHDSSELRRLADLEELNSQGQGGLLRAQDLDRVARWRERASAEWAERYVTRGRWDAVMAFIDRSQAEVEKDRHKTRRLKRLVTTFAWTVAVMLVAATMLSVWLKRVADDQTVAAQQAMMDSYVRTISTSGTTDARPAERVALWELAELPRDILNVREGVISHWFREEKAAPAALRFDGVGLRAAVGLDTALRDHARARAEELSTKVVDELAGDRAMDPQALQSLQSQTDLIATLAGTLDSTSAARIGARLIDKMKSLIPRDLAAATSVANALAAIVRKLDPVDGEPLALDGAQHLASWLQVGPVTAVENRVVSTLARIIGELGTAIRADVSNPLVDRLAAVVVNETAQTGRVFGAMSALTTMEKRIEPVRVPDVAVSTLAAVVTRTKPQYSDVDEIFGIPAFDRAFQTFSAKLRAADSVALADRLTGLLEANDNTARSDAWARAVERLAGNLQRPEAAVLGRRLLLVLEGRKQLQSHAQLALAIAAVSSRVDSAAEAALLNDRAAQVVVRSLESLPAQFRSSSISELGDLTKALTTLITPLAVEDSRSHADRAGRVLRVLLQGSSPMYEPSYLSRVVESAAVLAPRMEPGLASELADDVVDQVVSGTAVFIQRGRVFTNTATGLLAAITKVAPLLNGDRATKLTAPVTTLLTDGSPSIQSASGTEAAVAAFAASLPSDEAQIFGEELINVLAKAASTQQIMVATGLAAAVRTMPQQAALTIAPRAAAQLRDLLDAARDSTPALPELAVALAGVVRRIPPADVEPEAVKAAKSVIGAIQISKDTDGARLSRLGFALAQLVPSLPSAGFEARLLALSNMMYGRVPAESPAGTSRATELRKTLSDLMGTLDNQDLAEILKWPFCVGESEKLALAVIAQRTEKTPLPIWKFVARAHEFHLRGLAAPARRPSLEKALAELKGGGSAGLAARAQRPN